MDARWACVHNQVYMKLYMQNIADTMTEQQMTFWTEYWKAPETS